MPKPDGNGNERTSNNDIIGTGRREASGNSVIAPVCNITLTYMEKDIYKRMNAGDLSLLMETACELGNMMLAEKHAIPMEDMCDDNGEFTEAYQEEFNRRYDEIEEILINLYGRLHQYKPDTQSNDKQLINDTYSINNSRIKQ